MTHQPWRTGQDASALHVDEDGGLAALMGTQTVTLAREAALQESAILSAARDILQTAFATDERRRFLDPFAPAIERNAEVITVLRTAIAEHRQRNRPRQDHERIAERIELRRQHQEDHQQRQAHRGQELAPLLPELA